MKYNKFGNTVLICGDCIETMHELIDKGTKVDLVLTDPPFETSACATSTKWDKVIPFEEMWNCLTQIIKDNRAIVLFATQPFTSKLMMSNLNWWKYNWIWKKEQGTNFLNSKYQPLKVYEDICVFGQGATSYSKKGNLIYIPQMTYGAKPYKAASGIHKNGSPVVRDTDFKWKKKGSDGSRYPINILEYPRDRDGFHPTQKPVALLEYLIKTYSNEGEVVLDFTAGSFSTAIACINTNRKFIGIEKNREYFEIGLNRVKERAKSE